MSGIVFDAYTDLQGLSSTIANDGSWGPDSGSTRTTNNASQVTSTNGFMLGRNGSITGLLTYLYSTPQDFSQVLSIILTGTTATTVRNTFIMNLVDSSSNAELHNVAVSPPSPVSSTWNMSQFTTVNLTSIVEFQIRNPAFGVSPTIAYVNSNSLSSVIACIPYGSMIRMIGEEYKKVNELVRGDLIWISSSHDDLNRTSENERFYPVARVIHQIVQPNSMIDVTLLPKDCIQLGIPTKDTLLTSNHAIVYYNARRPAKCFINFPGVKRSVQLAKDVLPPNELDGKLYLYDIQYDRLGTFDLNGIRMKSRDPRSNLTPLPKDLYFEPKLYNNETYNDNPNEILPLDFSILDVPSSISQN